MYDEGSHGDQSSNDGKFTTQVTIRDDQSRVTYLQVSASYVGLTSAVLSKPLPLPIFPASPSPDQVLL